MESEMKAVKIAVVACSLLTAAAAWAQSEAPAGTAPQQVSQTATPQAAQASAQHRVAKPAKQAECVGPVSFCNVYFGS
jgi:hypothetical protein